MKRKYVVLILVVLAIVVLAWIELGVGIFGTPWAGS